MITKLILIFTMVFSLICPAKLKAANQAEQTHYQYELQNATSNVLYVIPQNDVNMSKVLLSSYQPNADITSTLIWREHNNYYVANAEDNEILDIPLIGVSPQIVYNYVWAFQFYYSNKTLTINIYNLEYSQIDERSNFQFVDSYIYNFFVDDNIIINIDYTNYLDMNKVPQNDITTEFYRTYMNNPLYLSAVNYYNNGYDAGFNEGVNTNLATPNWWTSLFNGIDSFLSIELLPNLTLGILVAIPLVFGLLRLILFFWRSGD